MGLIFLRTAIVFFALLIVMRLMGKRQIGEMQPFELVITLLIAELACIPMADTSIPLLYGIVSMLTIFLLHQIILILDLKVKPLKRIIGGKPSLVINKILFAGRGGLRAVRGERAVHRHAARKQPEGE